MKAGWLPLFAWLAACAASGQPVEPAHSAKTEKTRLADETEMRRSEIESVVRNMETTRKCTPGDASTIVRAAKAGLLNDGDMQVLRRAAARAREADDLLPVEKALRAIHKASGAPQPFERTEPYRLLLRKRLELAREAAP